MTKIQAIDHCWDKSSSPWAICITDGDKFYRVVPKHPGQSKGISYACQNKGIIDLQNVASCTQISKRQFMQVKEGDADSGNLYKASKKLAAKSGELPAVFKSDAEARHLLGGVASFKPLPMNSFKVNPALAQVAPIGTPVTLTEIIYMVNQRLKRMGKDIVVGKDEPGRTTDGKVKIQLTLESGQVCLTGPKGSASSCVQLGRLMTPYTHSKSELLDISVKIADAAVDLLNRSHFRLNPKQILKGKVVGDRAPVPAPIKFKAPSFRTNPAPMSLAAALKKIRSL